MTERRKMRCDEARTLETRAAEISFDQARKNILMEYEGPMDLDVSLIPDGYEWSWKRLAIFKTGEYEDSNNIAIAMKKGWKPVEAARYPHLRSFDFLGRDAELSNYINRGKSILMERPEELSKLEWQQINKKSNLQASTIASYHSGNPLFTPMTFENDARRGLPSSLNR